jgi:beta-lactamase regulating signal transducer with metallopeptidase domain
MSSFIRELSASPMSAWIARATLLLALAWALHHLLRSANPRWQVCLWRTTLVGLVGLPVLGLVVPSLRIDVAVEHDVRRDADESPGGVAKGQLDALQSQAIAREDRMRRHDATLTEALGATEVSILRTVESTADQSRFGIADWKLLAISIWLGVAGVLLQRILLSSLRIRRLIGESVSVESGFIEFAADVMKNSGLRQLPEIRTSSSVEVPFVAGLFRAVVVLPTGAERTANSSELRLILTHEFGHVAGRDVPWATLACIVRNLLWFHPLVWRLPSAHQVACETVCDALASQNDSSRATYRSLLARLALHVNAKPVFSSGVSMSATAEITRRIRRLGNHIPCESLPRRRGLVALIAGLVVTTAIAKATLVPRASANKAAVAKPSDKDTATIQGKDRAAEWTIRLNAIDADTGAPIASPEFTVQLGDDSTVHQGNAEGAFSALIPSRIPGYCYLKVRAAGYTPMQGFWGNRPNGVRDELPEELTFRMTHGITVGGTVVDEENQPVPGATVWFSAGQHVPEERVHQSFDAEEYTTDQQGQWRCSIAPREMNSATFKVNHPNYARITSNFGIDRQIDELKAQTHTWTLKKGFAIRGVVTGPDGAPVEGAHLALGTLNLYSDEGPFAVTDADGRYEFSRVGSSVREDDSQRLYQMSVTVLRKDLAPQLAIVPGTGDVELEPSTWNERTMDFYLDEGQPVTVRVTDSEDKPVEHVWIFPSEWRDGTNGLTVLRKQGIPEYTDKDGIWRWEHAPTGETIMYDILARGYMDVRNKPLIAGDEERVSIALMRPQILTGNVIDADTREPVDEFVIQKGFEGMSTEEYPDGVWWTGDTQGRGGRYRHSVSMPRPSYRWKFLAKGYEPFVSDSIPVDEDEFILNVALKKSGSQEIAPTQTNMETVLNQILALGGITSNKLDTYDQQLTGFPVVRISFAGNKKVTDEFLASLECFDRLEQLDLSETQITDAGLASVATLNGLRSLEISGTQVTDAGLTELIKLRSLTRLEIQSSQISDVGLATLAAYENLRELYLFNTKITDNGMRELKKLKQLTALSIARTPVTDKGLEELLNLQELEMLLLSQTQVTDEGVQLLKSLPKLKTLNLNATPITDAGLTYLVELKQLETVYLHKVPGISEAGVEQLKQSRPELHVVQ